MDLDTGMTGVDSIGRAKWKIPLQIFLLEVCLSQGGVSCFKGYNWPPFSMWQGEQIWLV
jgi:hypothetical protein